MTRIRALALGLLAAPLALGLAACGSGSSSDGPTASATAVAKVAPPTGEQWSDVISKTPEGGYRMGNPNAPIKLIEYGALSCSHCAKLADDGFATLRNTYIDSGRVSYELRYFMLNAFDIPAALLATCGSTETVIPLSEQFWAWQPNMFQNIQAAGDAKLKELQNMPPPQQIPAVAQLSGMTDFFAARGISKAQAQTCLADTAKAKALSDMTEQATKQYNVEGTPTFILNGSSIGSMEWGELETKLQEAGAR
ncbi:DsbA family protein [Novosphingobium sp. 9]|uniref:DsbA family protein n=1 Tax=Novosphingobium sp. 9 TaxID=2025349 RepID=UPI0021B57E22|nr:DsbA family protein [Novosphingobium sp. 9]